MKTTTNLPTEPSVSEQDQIQQLNQRVDSLMQQNSTLAKQLAWYQEQIRLLQHKQFGKSSEKSVPVDPNQLTLDVEVFNEAESLAQAKPGEPFFEEVTYTRKKSKGKRALQLDAFPQETIEYHATDEERSCPCCNERMHVMSTEVRRELKLIPQKLYVLNHVHYKYSCRPCEQNEVTTPVVKIQSPNPVLPKSFVSAELMAQIMCNKYVLGLPLYRQEKEFERAGLVLSRQTMANWMVAGAQTWLHLIYDRLHQRLSEQTILHADETRIQVLHEPGRKAESNSTMWLYRSGREEANPIVLYDYQISRGQEHPKWFLQAFRGYLHVDGYPGYHDLKSVQLVGCWAHARRKFDEAVFSQPDELKHLPSIAREGLQFCNQLFTIERSCKDKTAEERHATRQAKSKPLLEGFLSWLQQQEAKTLPKSALGKAITYCLNQWKKLNTFLEDGRLEIDNNRGERSIKPFVIGRKNWLFSNTPKGANSSAIIYSIIETAKENGLIPYEYLRYLFEQMPNQKIDDQTTLDQMLPWSDQIQSNCKLNNQVPASK